MDFLIVKWLHILSSTVIFGTGVGTAFCLFVANRSRHVPSIAFATRLVVLADWVFTTPAAVIQPLTGLWLMQIVGYPLTTGWIASAIILYVLAGACWLPVVWIQIRMKALARAAYEDGTDLPAAYWRFDRWWIGLGSLAFPAFVVIFWLMVAKPG